MPLKVREDGRGGESEAHLLNEYDARGNLPEYKPYSLVTYGYQPLSNWQKTNNPDSDQLYQRVAPFDIKTTADFKKMADENLKNSISFEIAEKVMSENGTSFTTEKTIIDVKDLKFLEYNDNQMSTRRRGREEHCSFIHGDYDEESRICT